MNRPHHYLSLSGGGADGAYGAGILVGWTAHGTRPEFTIVTGTSTGALIAPFAFLGPKYDPLLRKLYTEMTTADLVERRDLLDILRNDSATSAAPLRRLLEKRPPRQTKFHLLCRRRTAYPGLRDPSGRTGGIRMAGLCLGSQHRARGRQSTAGCSESGCGGG